MSEQRAVRRPARTCSATGCSSSGAGSSPTSSRSPTRARGRPPRSSVTETGTTRRGRRPVSPHGSRGRRQASVQDGGARAPGSAPRRWPSSCTVATAAAGSVAYDHAVGRLRQCASATQQRRGRSTARSRCRRERPGDERRHSAIDIQELAPGGDRHCRRLFASSSSTGGIGGVARTVNCSTPPTRAPSQGIGAMIPPVGSLDLTAVLHPAGSRARWWVRGHAGVRRRRDDDVDSHRRRRTSARQPDSRDRGRRRGRSRDASAPSGSAERAAAAPRLRASSSTELAPARRLPHAPRLWSHDFLPPSLRKRASTRARRARREGKPSTGSRHSRRREPHHRGSRRSPKGWQRSGARGSQRSSSPSCSRRRRFAACATERSSGDRSPCSHRSTSLSDPFVISVDPPTRVWAGDIHSELTKGVNTSVTEVHCSRRLHARVGSAFGRFGERQQAVERAQARRPELEHPVVDPVRDRFAVGLERRWERHLHWR